MRTNTEIMWLTNSIELPDALQVNLISTSCSGVAPSYNWTVSVGGSHFGIVEWPFRDGAETGIMFASHMLRVPFGIIPVVAGFAILSLAVIIVALAFRARHRHSSPDAG